MIYEYHCEERHLTTKWRKMSDRNNPVTCDKCGKPSSLIISKQCGQPDGIYSYAPNIGDPDRFERQRQAIKEGKKVIPRHR